MKKLLKNVKLWVCLLLLYPLLGAAGEPACKSAKADAPLDQYFTVDQKLGEGTVYKFVIPAYDISLWSKRKPWSYDNLFALQVRCRWNATQKEMIDSTIEVMERDPTLTKEKSDAYRKLLESFYPALKDGDRVTVVYKPGESLDFYHNTQLLKKVDDMVFAKHFCNIWLSPNTKYTSAREDMLGEK